MKKKKTSPPLLYKDSNYVCSFQREIADIEKNIPRSLKKTPSFSVYAISAVSGSLSYSALEKIFDELTKKRKDQKERSS